MAGTLNLGSVKGRDGTDGADGRSAYQQAVDGGYTGTEAEFKAMLANGPWLPTAGGALHGSLNLDGHTLLLTDNSAAAISTEGERVQITAEGGGPVTVGDGCIDGLTADPTQEDQAVPLGFADRRYLQLSGGTIEGELNMNKNRLFGLLPPENDNEPATKGYADSIIANGVPAGVIVLWSGSEDNIPTGWTLCNGQNGAPDLRDRFVVGAGASYAVDETGGAAGVALSVAQLPSHGHGAGTLSAQEAGDHTHEYEDAYPSDTWNAPTGGGGQFYNQYRVNTKATQSAGAHTHTVSGTTGATGSGAEHENRPPYYALCYIMKLATSTPQEAAV